MLTTIQLKNKTVTIDLSKPLDISIPLRAGDDNVNAFYIPPVKIEPFEMGRFIGDVNKGGACNVNNITFNPHGNGTHTECVGHISTEKFTINKCLTQFWFDAELITITPKTLANGDAEIMLDDVKSKLQRKQPEALVIRTSPNTDEKINKQYSGTNPVYINKDLASYLVSLGVKHLLIDIPSVDKEDDGGQLSAHHIFWQYPQNIRLDATITELVYVKNEIIDGSYMINIQIASFENDVSPSKPVLYKTKN
jgi:arylformamidase